MLRPLYRVRPNLNLYLAAVDIQARYRFAFYDSLIISAALEAGCKFLYSEDMQNHQRIQGLIIENPFKD